MIFTESTIKISNNVSKMDSTIVLYRGDKNVEIRFTILQSPFKYSNTVATNVIESTNASYGQLVIKTPNDKPPIFSEVSATKEGTVLFTITKEMIDEIEELGVYTFQIRLMDEKYVNDDKPVVWSADYNKTYMVLIDGNCDLQTDEVLYWRGGYKFISLV